MERAVLRTYIKHLQQSHEFMEIDTRDPIRWSDLAWMHAWGEDSHGCNEGTPPEGIPLTPSVSSVSGTAGRR